MSHNNKTIRSIILNQIWLIAQHCLPTKLYLSLRYYVIFKKRLDWKHPKTFSEKIQWLKVYGFKEEYVTYVDKVLVKDYVSKIIGEEYIIPTLGVWSSAEKIHFEDLPNQFVLKCNHNSGAIAICTDKTCFDENNARALMQKCLKDNYYLNGREKPYKYVNRQIFAEQYMHDNKTDDLRDYKFFCFNGVPKALFIASDRQSDVRFDFFDMDFKHLPIRNGYDNSPNMIERPETFEKMKDIATKLSKGLPHVRIDLYEINGHVYFGEMTLYHFNGFMPFEPDEWDYKFGSWLKLPI